MIKERGELKDARTELKTSGKRGEGRKGNDNRKRLTETVLEAFRAERRLEDGRALGLLCAV